MWKIACDSSQLSLLVTLAEARAALEAAAELALVACALCMLHPHIRLFTKHRDRGATIPALNAAHCVHLSFSAML